MRGGVALLHICSGCATHIVMRTLHDTIIFATYVWIDGYGNVFEIDVHLWIALYSKSVVGNLLNTLVSVILSLVLKYLPTVSDTRYKRQRNFIRQVFFLLATNILDIHYTIDCPTLYR